MGARIPAEFGRRFLVRRRRTMTDATRSEKTTSPETAVAEGERLPEWAARLPLPLPEGISTSIPVRMIERFIAISGVDLAFRLAAQAFISLIPLMVVAASFAAVGGGKSFRTTLLNLLGLHGAPQSVLNGLAGTGRQVRDSLTVVGVVVLIYSTMSFTRTLRRVFERSWNLPRRGVKGMAGDILWLASLILFFVFLAWMRGLLGERYIVGLVMLGFSAAFWMWSASVMVGWRVPLKRLVPTGLVMAAGLIALSLVSVVYMPRLIVSKNAQFGQVGVVFAIVSWLIICASVIVAGSAIGAVLGESGEERETSP